MDASIQNMGDVAVMQARQPNLAGKLLSKGNIDKTAENFESMFASQMLQPMFAGIGVNPMFGGGHGEEVMRSFMIDEYGKQIGKRGMLGIGAAVKNEMIRAQAQQSAMQMKGTSNVTGS